MEKIQLNPAQRKAVQHKEGPLLIIAGAGTGKTRVITQRIKWLFSEGFAKSDEILALTFTQKAAQEMEERVDEAMPYGYEPMWISTFHSFCDSILRQEAIYIGLDPGYTLMSQAQEYVFFRRHLFDMSLDRFRPQGNPTKFIGEMLKHFSRLGDEDVSPDDYMKFLKKTTKDVSDEEHADLQELAVVFGEYTEMKQKESVLGFADLVPLALRLFRERSRILERYREKFRYILVDEFQDTNYAQNELVAMLAGNDGNITVVGDDDQSIYKFRGAAISNILDFQEKFPSYTKVVLTKNYRSRQEILDLAYGLIRNNDPYRLEVTEKIDKRLVSARTLSGKVSEVSAASEQIKMLGEREDTVLPTGSSRSSVMKDAVRRIHTDTEVAEAEAVAEEITKMVADGVCDYRDIAILVRAHNHADECVHSLRYHGIPYRFLGAKGLYTRPEVKDMIAFLKVLVDYSDDISMFRLLTLECGDLSPREFVELQRLARRRKMSMFVLLEELFDRKIGVHSKGDDEDGDEAPGTGGVVADDVLAKASRDWISLLLDIFEDSFVQVKAGKSVGVILYDFIDKSGYITHLTSQDVEGRKAQENEWKVKNISAYFDSIKRFERENTDPSVRQYMDYLEYSLEIGESPQVDQEQIAEFEGVNISTIHGAKGLEFPIVFIMNMVNERFPTRRRSDVLPVPEGIIKEKLPEGDEHIQEERRLCYVGMTRAMDMLYLTSADYYAQGIRRKKQSIFLSDVDLVKEQAEKSAEGARGDLSRAALAADDMEIVIPDDVRRNFLKKIERNLSYSHISSFNTCPYQFYFKYVLGIPGIPSPAKSYGLTIHNTMREFYTRLMRAKQGFEGIEKPPDLEDLLEIFEQKWQSEGYENKSQENRRFNTGKKSLTTYYEQFYSEDQNPVLLEGRFKVDIGGVRLSGVVDRLDEVEDGLEVIDYKTGKVPKDRRSVQRDLQVPIYVLAMEQLRGKEVVKASYLYIESGENIDIEVTEEGKKKAESEVKSTFAEIQKMKFPAKPSMLCRYCDYRTICDYAMMK